MKSKLQNQIKDNLLRKGSYKKDMENEQYIEQMNILLMEKEKTKYQQIPDNNTRPIIFVLGLPRSGTTLLTQLLIAGLNVGYIDNLVARFWLAPIHGIRLSRAVLEKKQFSFTSDYGKTPSIDGPHEFSYFWHYWFKMENIPPYIPSEIKDKIDWHGFKTVLRNIVFEFNKPLIMKAMDVEYHIKTVMEKIPETFIILIRRDLSDVSVSLKKGRIKYYNDYDKWLSMYPIEYERIAHLKGEEQIAAQVFYLNKMIENGVRECFKNRVIEMSLDELCENPHGILDKIIEVIGNNQLKIKNKKDIPKKFLFSTFKNSDEYRRFTYLLKKLSNENSKQKNEK